MNVPAGAPPYGLAIFDFDGTLADSMSRFGEHVNRAADRFRFGRIDDERLERFRDLEARAIVSELGVPLWKLPMIATFMRSLSASEPSPLFAGVPELLRHLRARSVVVAIVSSNSEQNVRRALGPPLTDAIACFECGVSIFGKASRLRRVVRRIAIPPERAIYVGDELRDADAARAARIAFGAVTWGYNREEALRARSPSHVFSSFDEIARRVAGAEA
ncbi:hydrolase, haloacid dehalogenase-like family [Vulgatibacter incomptus]|uniref:Hydrolase, haloacid dehalogenase-like family n=2 Tax=Vulgatibacter incomptus TaxID=1391653 RepID=A0A0K1PEP1_9BACT|nr:hydrolase, haloacid dehalogenase-like family [Vulgatibacter incomptus]